MIPTPNAIKCAMRFNQAGLEAYNIFYALGSAPATSANLVTVAGVIQNWWNVTHRPIVASAVQWLGVDLTAQDSTGAPFLAYNNSGTLAGVVASTIWPPQITLAVALRTGLSGRSYRGRIYHIGLAQNVAISGGLILASAAATVAGSYNTLRTSLATAGFPLCIVSLYSGVDVLGQKIPRTTGVATVVNSVACGIRVDTQRRRLPVESRA